MSGRLEVKKETEFQGKQVIVGVYREGTLVGDLCILDGRPKSVTAVAIEDANLLLLSRDSFEKLLTEHPRAAANLLKGMLLAVSTRLSKAYERLTSIF
jgi:CRP-like cAMP-binding protein